jgi:hypothetical protein
METDTDVQARGVARRGVAGAARGPEDRVRRYQALLHPLLLLHAPVLEPDLHLGLVQLQGGGDLDAASAGQVLVEVELLLELRELLIGEVGATGVVETRGHAGRGRCHAQRDATRADAAAPGAGAAGPAPCPHRADGADGAGPGAGQACRAGHGARVDGADATGDRDATKVPDARARLRS